VYVGAILQQLEDLQEDALSSCLWADQDSQVGETHVGLLDRADIG